MAMSEAAIQGIKENGHGWKISLYGLIKPECSKLAEFNNRINDDGGEVLREESESVVMEIVRKLREWTTTNEAKLGEQICRDLRGDLDDLESVEDCDMEEINYAMGRVYDCFDYWRILAA